MGWRTGPPPGARSMSHRHRQARKRRQRREPAALALSDPPEGLFGGLPPATPVNPVAVALEAIERREQALLTEGAADGPEEDVPEAPRGRSLPALPRFDWRSAVDARSLIYMGVALFVAVLVFLVLRYFEMSDLAPASLTGF